MTNNINDNRLYDIIIFGATGYTGRYVIEELAIVAQAENVKWAIAGRNIEKLRSSLQSVQQYLPGIDILDTPIVQADVFDKSSITNMCQKTKLILNCCGPYKLYGEAVVSACIETLTHHLDLSGEFKFLETTQAKYFHVAKEKGIYIIQACGFDSIPADFGVSLIRKNFRGDLNSVEYYVEVKQGPSGRKTNFGTYLSIIESIQDYFNVSQFNLELKKKVFRKVMVPSIYPLRSRFPVFFSDVVKGLCIWFLGPDERVIQRSQMARFEFLNQRPIQVQGYVKLPSLFALILTAFSAGIIGLLSFFSVGRYFLAKYPSFFTFGQFSKDGPTRQQVKEGSTKFTFVGNGWKDAYNSYTEHDTEPDITLKMTMTGPEPAYPLTAICMVQAGMIVLTEYDSLPIGGGVLTPGVVFENSSLRGRLEERGVVFTFEKKDIKNMK